jgi:hypothetical protein
MCPPRQVGCVWPGPGRGGHAWPQPPPAPPRRFDELSPASEGGAEVTDVFTLLGPPSDFAKRWLPVKVNAAEIARSEATFDIAVTVCFLFPFLISHAESWNLVVDDAPIV